MEPSEAALDHCHTEPLQTHLLELRERERVLESVCAKEKLYHPKKWMSGCCVEFGNAGWV